MNKNIFLVFLTAIVIVTPLLCHSCMNVGDDQSRQDNLTELDSIRQEWVRYFEYGMYDSLVRETRPFLASKIAEKDTQAVIYSSIFIAQALILQEDMDSVPYYIDILEKYYDHDKISDENILTLYYNVLGINSLKINLDFTYALECFSKTLELDKKQGDTVNVVVSLANIAYIYLMKNDSSGLEYAREAFELSSSESMPDYIKCHTALLMAQMCYLIGNYEESQKYLLSGAAIAETNGFNYHKTLIHLIQANLDVRQGNITEAEKEYERASEYLSDAEPTIAIKLCLDRGNFYALEGKYDKAIALMQKGISMSYEHKSPAMRGSLLRYLSEIYDTNGNPSKSLYYYKQFVKYQDSVSAVEHEQEFRRLVLSLRNMEHANEIKTKEVELLTANRRLLIITGILAIIALTAVFIWLLYRRQKKTYKTLVKQHQSYVEKLKREEEKQRLPKDDYKDLFEKIDNAMKQERLYCSKELTQERLAEIMQTNRTYISKAINTYAGMTFNNYINSYRIGEAVRMISSREFDMPFKQLADMLGYSSVYVFSKAFQRETGIAPGIYRKEILKSQSEPPRD